MVRGFRFWFIYEMLVWEMVDGVVVSRNVANTHRARNIKIDLHRIWFGVSVSKGDRPTHFDGHIHPHSSHGPNIYSIFGDQRNQIEFWQQPLNAFILLCCVSIWKAHSGSIKFSIVSSWRLQHTTYNIPIWRVSSRWIAENVTAYTSIEIA